MSRSETVVHSVSVVVPVYQGERTLDGLVKEIAVHFEPSKTSDGHPYAVSEILLVSDRGPDNSDAVMRDLAARIPQVRTVWLSRNYGQHAATLAGMASSGGDWIATLDEDGQHDPAYIPDLIDTALREQAQVVYALPTNEPPHGFRRNLASRVSKWLVRRVSGGGQPDIFQSYRLVTGEIGRSIAAYAGAGVYLDVAMSWVTARIAQCPVELRAGDERTSGYSTRTLLSHFWRLVISSGTRGLRMVSMIGITFALLGFLLALYILVGSITGSTTAQGWSSVMVVLCLSSGAILFSMGVIAEYIGVAVNMAMGKPLYLIISDQAAGPLGRTPAPRED